MEDEIQNETGAKPDEILRKCVQNWGHQLRHTNRGRVKLYRGCDSLADNCTQARITRLKVMSHEDDYLFAYDALAKMVLLADNGDVPLHECLQKIDGNILEALGSAEEYMLTLAEYISRCRAVLVSVNEHHPFESDKLLPVGAFVLAMADKRAQADKPFALGTIKRACKDDAGDNNYILEDDAILHNGPLMHGDVYKHAVLRLPRVLRSAVDAYFQHRDKYGSLYNYITDTEQGLIP